MKEKIDKDYIDICNTLSNVAVSINEMLATRELEQIETNLSKSLTEIQKIHVEMCSKPIQEVDEISLESTNDSTLVSDSGMLPIPGKKRFSMKPICFKFWFKFDLFF